MKTFSIYPYYSPNPAENSLDLYDDRVAPILFSYRYGLNFNIINF